MLEIWLKNRYYFMAWILQSFVPLNMSEKKRERGEEKKDGKLQFKKIFGINSNYLSVSRI